MIILWRTILPIVIILLGLHESLKVDDSVHYMLKFQTEDAQKFDKNDDLMKPNEKFNEENTLTVSTQNSETFVCHIPTVITENKQGRRFSYTGPSPAELIEPITKGKICSYRLDPYWSYELCHGRYVLQYHEEKELRSSIRTEFYLGNLRADYAYLSDHEFDQLNPPKKKVDDQDVAYFPVLYTQGTTCDITGKPRTTNILYVCHPEGREQIHSLIEISSCNYEAIVQTARLCSHPAFTPPNKKEHEIVCYDKNGRRDPHPEAFISLNAHHEETFKREYTAREPSDGGERLSVDKERLAERLDREFESMERRKVEESAERLRYKHEYTQKGGNKAKIPESPDTQRINQQIAQDTVNRILSGKECITGGAGWWHYEFCYGATVTQYHTETNGGKAEILLGSFDKEIHKAWIEQNVNKKPVKSQGKIQQISHIYVRGDMCQETRAHRSVEVQIRCKTVDGSKLAVALSLDEPQTCRYVLVVESERFCSIIQNADDYGMISTKDLTDIGENNPFLPH